MAIAHVQQQFGFFDGALQTSLAVAFPGNVTAGNCIVVFAKYGTATSVFQSITDTLGNTYTQVDSVTGGAAGANTLKSFTAQSPSGGANTVTLNFTGANGVYPRLTIGEWSGADTTASLVNAHESANQLAPGAGTDAITSAGSASTTVANCMLVAFCQDHDNTGQSSTHTMADGTGFTGLLNGQTAPNYFDVSRLSDGILAAAGAAHATFTDTTSLSSTDNYTTMMVALQPPQAADALMGQICL